MKAALGLDLLDEALDGGLPEGSTTFLVAPSTLDVRGLAYRFLVHGLDQLGAGVLVLIDHTAQEARERLAEISPYLEEHEADDRLRYIDACTRTLGLPEDAPRTTYVDHARQLNQLTRAVNDAERTFGSGRAHRLVLESATGLVGHTNPSTMYRFLKVLTGRLRAAGGTALVLVDRDLLAAVEEVPLAHLADGRIEIGLGEDGLEWRILGHERDRPSPWRSLEQSLDGPDDKEQALAE